MDETALSYKFSWSDRLLEWIFKPRNWLGLMLMFLGAHALLFLVAWLAGWVALPGEGQGLLYAAYLASFNAATGIVLIAWSLVKNHEMGVGSGGYIMGSLVGGTVGSLLVLVLGGLWRVIEFIFNFLASPPLIALDVVAGIIAVISGIILAALASVTGE